MKFKKDFITNSSSTSFVGWGISLNDSDLRNEKEFLEIAFKKYKDINIEDTQTFTFDEFMDEDNGEVIREAIDNLFPYNKERLLECSYGPNGDDFMIAGPVNRLKDDQTLGEYKKQIIEELNKVGLHVSGVSYIEESWYNG